MREALLAKPTDSYLLCAIDDNQQGDSLRTWDVRTGQAVVRTHAAVNINVVGKAGLDVSPNGKYLAVGGRGSPANALHFLDNWDYALPIFNSPTGLGNGRGTGSWYDDRYYMVTNGVSTTWSLEIWDMATVPPSSIFSAPTIGQNMSTARLSTDRQCIAVVSNASPYLEVYSLANPLSPVYMTRPTGARAAMDAAIYRDNMYVTDAGTGTIERYQRSGTGAAATYVYIGNIATGLGSNMRGIDISDSGLLAVATGAGDLRLYQLSQDGSSASLIWQMTTFMALPAGATLYDAVSISRDGKLLAATATGGTNGSSLIRARLWSLALGTNNPTSLTLPGAISLRNWQNIAFNKGLL